MLLWEQKLREDNADLRAHNDELVRQVEDALQREERAEAGGASAIRITV